MYGVWKSIFALANTLPPLVAFGVLCFFFEAKNYLGHWPIVSIDDPKNLPFWDHYDFLWEPLLLAYLVLFANLVVVFFKKKLFKTDDQRTIGAVTILNWVLYFSLHALPRINILEWYLD